jgi:ATP-binding cassette subfamily F protein 3
LIRLNGVRYSIGTRTLFDGVDWPIGPGDRVALVGPNGAGKTTLLKIALGEITPERGTRVLSKGSRIGYLPQEAAEKFEGTVLGRALDAHRHLIQMREELDALYQEIPLLSQEDPEMERLLDRAGELQHHLEQHDEHALEPEARRVLAGLGFSTEDQDRPLSEFSGGWRMRAALAALLLTDPTLLFLDEPTNHLDLPAMEWLEDYLEEFHGGLVVVSHDRVFLDRVTSEIRELDHEELTEYPMTFTEYLEEREARRERIEAQNVQLDKKIAQLERFAERFGAKNTKAAQAHSKRRQAERLRQRRVVLPRKPRSIRFQFPPPPHVGRVMVQLDEAAFAYDSRDIFRDATLEIQKGEKLAIVGANGAGKTTLLRVLAGQLDPREGEREIHPQARLGYFAQHAAETLDGHLTVLEAVEEVASDDMRMRLRSLLGNFLFIGDDVFKHCRILSGGERQRVALARLLLTPANLILLDEPTHHLDLAGKEVLEEALIQYPGAVVVVTHDRSLMARLATRILAVEDGRVVPYPGGYDDYEAARLAKTEAAARGTSATKPPAMQHDGRAATVPKAANAPAKAAASTATAKPKGDPRKRKQEEERLAKELETRESELKEIEGALANPAVYADSAKTKDLLARYEAARKDVDALWAKLAAISEISEEPAATSGKKTRT